MMSHGWLKEAVAGGQGRVSPSALPIGIIDGSYSETAKGIDNLSANYNE